MNILEDANKKNGEIGEKELKSLKNHNYSLTKEESNYVFVLRNKKTKAIVEIEAQSSIMAAKIVGWRPRHVELISCDKK